MEIYLTHPQHGTHVVYAQQEADECLKNGWQLKQAKPEAKPETKPVLTLPKHGRPRTKHGNH